MRALQSYSHYDYNIASTKCEEGKINMQSKQREHAR